MAHDQDLASAYELIYTVAAGKNYRREAHDIAAQHPEIVAKMSAAYEDWWKSAVPLMVNENAPLAKENPFWVLYQKQFGELPPNASKASEK